MRRRRAGLVEKKVKFVVENTQDEHDRAEEVASSEPVGAVSDPEFKDAFHYYFFWGVKEFLTKVHSFRSVRGASSTGLRSLIRGGFARAPRQTLLGAKTVRLAKFLGSKHFFLSVSSRIRKVMFFV